MPSASALYSNQHPPFVTIVMREGTISIPAMCTYLRMPDLSTAVIEWMLGSLPIFQCPKILPLLDLHCLSTFGSHYKVRNAFQPLRAMFFYFRSTLQNFQIYSFPPQYRSESAILTLWSTSLKQVSCQFGHKMHVR